MICTIGEMAKLLDIPASTLRFYDQQRILPFVERTGGGLRMFTDKDYEWLKVVECLKNSGLSIREIRDFIGMVDRGDDSLQDRLALFESRREAVRKQIDNLQQMMALLNYKCWYYEQAVQEGTERRVHDLPLDELPEEFQEAKRQLSLAHK